ncbi:hypothetical protein ACFSM5_04485 [Lacibacterium aquatile]|uniref:Uncharacterized protein n=1 Tax=Lacibacterium aquatile TaxID=1168082 RepID=A0ABW5DLX4_9PROT
MSQPSPNSRLLFWIIAPAIGFGSSMLLAFLTLAFARWIGWPDLGGAVVGFGLIAVWEAGTVRQTLGQSSLVWVQAFLVLPAFLLGTSGLAVNLVPGGTWLMPMLLALLVPAAACAWAAFKLGARAERNHLIAASIWLIIAIIGMPVDRDIDSAYRLLALSGTLTVAVINIMLGMLWPWMHDNRDPRLLGLFPWLMPVLLAESVSPQRKAAPPPAPTPVQPAGEAAAQPPVETVVQPRSTENDERFQSSKTGPTPTLPANAKVISAAALRMRRKRRPSR